MSWTPVHPERGVSVTSPRAGPSSSVTSWAGWDLRRPLIWCFAKFFDQDAQEQIWLMLQPFTHMQIHKHRCTHTQVKVLWNSTHSYCAWYFTHSFLVYSISFTECWWWPTTLISHPTLDFKPQFEKILILLILLPPPTLPRQLSFLQWCPTSDATLWATGASKGCAHAQIPPAPRSAWGEPQCSKALSSQLWVSLFLLRHLVTCGILVTPPRMAPMPAASEGRVLTPGVLRASLSLLDISIRLYLRPSSMSWCHLSHFKLF